MTPGPPQSKYFVEIVLTDVQINGSELCKLKNFALGVDKPGTL